MAIPVIVVTAVVLSCLMLVLLQWHYVRHSKHLMWIRFRYLLTINIILWTLMIEATVTLPIVIAQAVIPPDRFNIFWPVFFQVYVVSSILAIPPALSAAMIFTRRLQSKVLSEENLDGLAYLIATIAAKSTNPKMKLKELILTKHRKLTDQQKLAILRLIGVRDDMMGEIARELVIEFSQNE